jgi:predicted MFS family arabinose efflux permease
MTSQKAAAGPAIVVGVASALTANMMPLLVASFARAFDLSAASAGRITAIEMFGVCLGSLLIAVFLARLTVSRLMLAALLLIIGANLLTIALGPQVLPPLRFVAGVGEGAGTAAMTAVLAGTAAPQRFFGIFICGTYALATVMFRANMTIAAVGGDRAIFWVLAAVAALAIPAAFFSRQASGGAREASLDAASRGRTLCVVIALVATVFYLAAWTNTWSYAVDLGRWAGLTPQTCSVVLGNAVIAGGVGAVLAVVVGARLGNFVPLLAAGSLMTAAATLMVLKLTPTTFGLAVLGWMAGMQFIGPYLVAVVSSADPNGRAASVSIAAQTLGIAIGPALGSTVVGQANAPVLVGLSIVLLVPSLVALLAVERLLGRSAETPPVLRATAV